MLRSNVDYSKMGIGRDRSFTPAQQTSALLQTHVSQHALCKQHRSYNHLRQQNTRHVHVVELPPNVTLLLFQPAVV